MNDSGWIRSWKRIKRLFGRRHDFISIVVLLKAPRSLDEAQLRSAAERAWNVTLGEGRDPLNYVVTNGPVRFVQVNGHFLHVLSGARPYIEQRDEFAAGLRDLRARAAVIEHRAWMSVDYLHSGRTHPSKDEKYGVAGKLVAEFLGDDCLAICIPDENMVIATTGELPVQLRQLESLRDLMIKGCDPVVEVAPEKAEAAAAEARRRWPEFVSAFTRRKKDDRFLIKKRFSDEKNVEFMWIEVKGLDEERISGVLTSEPAWLKQPRPGDTVTLTCAEVEDWAYFDDGEINGMFLKEL